MDKLITVYAPEHVRIQRVMHRDPQRSEDVITSYSIHYTKLYESDHVDRDDPNRQQGQHARQQAHPDR